MKKNLFLFVFFSNFEGQLAALAPSFQLKEADWLWGPNPEIPPDPCTVHLRSANQKPFAADPKVPIFC